VAVAMKTVSSIVLFWWLVSPPICLAGKAISPTSQSYDLSVPAYPGWILRQMDRKKDRTRHTEATLYQYVSDDPADKIVDFYEDATARQAVFSSVSATYTIYTADGTMINVLSPKEGVPQLDSASERIVRTWKSMVTIIRFQSVTP
jgi:hypothetical protein